MEFTVSRQVDLFLKLFAVLSVLSHMSYAAVPLLIANSVGKPCPGEVVTFTCTVSGMLLQWSPSDLTTPLNAISIRRNQSDRDHYTAVLISNTSTTITSTLTTTARDGVTIGCMKADSTITTTVTILLTVPPSPPVNVRHSVQSSTTDEAVVSVQWDPPDNNGGRDDLNYTVSISPTTTDLSATVVTSTTVTVTADYNEDYTINIMATNCAGNSMAVEYMFRVVPPILCGLPQSPVNGSLGSHLPSSPLGTTVIFQCENGLFPTDVRTATCRDMSGRGEWEPNPADLVCRESTNQVNCGVPMEPENGTISDYDNINTIEESVITFQCDPGFSPEGEMTATCNNSGLWTNDPARVMCTMSQAQTPVALTTGAVVGITAVVVFIVSLFIGFLTGLLVMYMLVRNKLHEENNGLLSTNPPPPQEQPPPPGPVYEEVSTPKENIELETNSAYGPVRR